MKYRYFLKDAQDRYRGLFYIDERLVDKLRDKGWTARRAGNRFGRVHPWKQGETWKSKQSQK